MASSASQKPATVSLTAAGALPIIGEHRIEAPPHRKQIRSPRLVSGRQPVAARGAVRRMGEKRLDLLDWQRSRSIIRNVRRGVLAFHD